MPGRIWVKQWDLLCGKSLASSENVWKVLSRKSKRKPTRIIQLRYQFIIPRPSEKIRTSRLVRAPAGRPGRVRAAAGRGARRGTSLARDGARFSL